jgi:hypothetical protein
MDLFLVMCGMSIPARNPTISSNFWQRKPLQMGGDVVGIYWPRHCLSVWDKLAVTEEAINQKSDAMVRGASTVIKAGTKFK